MITRRGLAFTVTATALLGLSACGGEGEVEPERLSQGALLSAACSSCHGAGGSAVPAIDGLTEQQLLTALTRYKNGDGGNVMYRAMRGYNDEEIKLIAAYLGRKS